MTMDAEVVRIAQDWDTPGHRAFCAALPDHVAQATGTAIIHRGRNTLARLDADGLAVVAKRFPPKRGLKGWLRRGCKATQAYDHAARLVELGIGTPTPLAVVRHADGSSCYLCTWAENSRRVWDLHDGLIPESDRIATDLGAFVACMHLAGVLHRDNTPGNILLKPVDDRFEFLVVDTNRMRFGSVGLWAGLGSLVQLECDDRLLEGYCWARGCAGGLARLIFRIQRLRHRFNWWLKDGTRPLRRRLGL